LQAKSARIVIPQNNDEELMEAFQLITAKASFMFVMWMRIQL
jgi:hypothetical protein